MITPSLPSNEEERLKKLASYEVLDTLPEQAFDDITRIASQICGTPVSLITLLDDKRQWFKSHRGLDVTETPREVAFCSYTILDPDSILVVKDATKDKRFGNNPLVVDDPHVIFYAGAPLITSDGYALGSLCVIDHKPNDISEEQIKSLEALARQVVAQLELRKTILQQKEDKEKIEKINEELNKFAYIASHDLKNPLQSIITLAELIFEDHGQKLDNEGQDLFHLLTNSAKNLTELVDEILEYSKLPNIINLNKEDVDVKKLLDDLFSNIDGPEELEIELPESIPTIYTNRMALYQIFLNLISNGIKYNLSKQPTLTISFKETEAYYHFSVKDNGMGIRKEYQAKIFEMFETLGEEDRFGKRGTGIGLATVKKLVESLGGKISLESEEGKGSEFSFSVEKRKQA